MAGLALSGDQRAGLMKVVRIEIRQFYQSVKVETFRVTAPELIGVFSRERAWYACQLRV